MNLTISGHHLEVTPALREYVLTKLDRITRHFDQVVDVNVLLTVEKLKEKERRQKAEVTLHVKGKDIFVEQAHEDLYAAIDQLMDKLDRQVCRHKDRVPATRPDTVAATQHTTVNLFHQGCVQVPCHPADFYNPEPGPATRDAGLLC